MPEQSGWLVPRPRTVREQETFRSFHSSLFGLAMMMMKSLFAAPDWLSSFACFSSLAASVDLTATTLRGVQDDRGASMLDGRIQGVLFPSLLPLPPFKKRKQAE
jgi:hypothetical protein